MTERKETNPKDAVGISKVPLSVIPLTVIAELGLAMLEGARKYGRHNYRRAGVRASVYVDATFRHIAAFWEGEDIDPDSGLSHITKAIASLTVLRDSMIRENWQDDRPPRVKAGWLAGLNTFAADLMRKYPVALAPHIELDPRPAGSLKGDKEPGHYRKAENVKRRGNSRKRTGRKQ